MEDRTPAGFGRKFYQLNYCNGRNASKRVLYDSQHSRTAPLARPLFRCILLSTITRIYIYIYAAQDTSPSSIHYARTNAVFIQRAVYTRAPPPIRETLNPRASFFTAI